MLRRNKQPPWDPKTPLLERDAKEMNAYICTKTSTGMAAAAF